MGYLLGYPTSRNLCYYPLSLHHNQTQSYIMMQNSIILQNVSLSDIEALFSKVIDDKMKSITPTTSVTDKLLTRQETARLLKISLPTLDDWTKTGVIKAKRIGTRIRYAYRDVEAAIKDLPNLKYSRRA